MTTFSINMVVLLYKDTATGKYVKIGTRFNGGRMEKYVILVDDAREAEVYTDRAEIDRLPEETKQLLLPYRQVPARMSISN